MSNLFLNILTLLAVIQSVDNLLHSFTILCENEYFLISNLHCSFTNFTSCPHVLLTFLREKNIIISINISYPFNILKTPLNLFVSRVAKSHSFRRYSYLWPLSSGIILVALLCMCSNVSISNNVVFMLVYNNLNEV